MRVIAGTWRGRSLTAPAGQATRPTSDRTREALFSMLASRLGTFEGLRALDLFAGSGALGFEALSRGAAHCTFVEQDSAAIAAIRANAAKLGATVDIRVQSATALAGGPFDLIFADAPYGSGLAQQALTRVVLAPGGWASIETARDEAVTVPGFVVAAERTHGKARLTLLQPA